MQGPPRCLRCGGHRLTTPTSMSSAPAEPPYLIYKSPGGGFLDQGVRLRCLGSACLDCGHVTVSLDPESLQRARAAGPISPW